MTIEKLKKRIEMFSEICGVDGVVLGGSRCINASKMNSDFDVCIYYNSHFNYKSVNSILSIIDDYRRNCLLPQPYYWGRNLNSGCVFMLDGFEIDLCLRETSLIVKTIDDCINGEIKVSYQAGYPFGFCNTYFVSEVNYCLVLYDIYGKIKHLKQVVFEHWDKMLLHIRTAFLYEAAFQWICARKQYEDDPLYNKSELNDCIFSLLNVYACDYNIMFFHNKHSIRRLKHSSGDARIMDNIKRIEGFDSINNYNEKMLILGNMILTEKRIGKLYQIKDEEYIFKSIEYFISRNLP